ncbi:proton-coupled folate transporter-like [Wyeomyia smithii]|uniref:proton-coupled folate transporter-like n=1 Tax=Wyeomyia smithii TaxID=174621 RepID=UPI002467DCD8|nr:proton-coupled folate transporter-like [Wyeomyia smithii]
MPIQRIRHTGPSSSTPVIAMDETTFSSSSMYSSGEEEILASEGLRLSRSTRWRERSRHVSYEPAVLLFCFALSLSEIELTHQIIYQTCQVQGFELHDCLLVGTGVSTPGVAEIEAQVKPAAATVTTTIVVIKAVIPAFSAIVFGAWSDRYGRKPVVVIASFGLLFSYVGLAGLHYLSSFMQLNSWYYVAAYIPFSVVGGMATLGAALFAFIADVTNDQNRTVRMGWMNAFMLAGTLAGFCSSKYILDWTSTTTFFVIATICVLLGLLYTALLVEDSIIPSSDGELGPSLGEFFSISLVRDIAKAASRKRTRFVWWILWLIIFCNALIELAAGGSLVEFSFIHHKFDWSLMQYNHFVLIERGLAVLANVVGILVLKRLFEWTDTVVALVSIISYIAGSTTKGFAAEGWQFYLACGLSSLKGMEWIALLSVSTYFLPSNEIAKFYALAFSLIGLIPLASPYLFGYVYEATESSGPEMYNFVAAGIYSLGFLILGLIQWLVNRRNQPELLL